VPPHAERTQLLLDALRDVCSQSSVADTARQIRLHAPTLFPQLALHLDLGDADHDSPAVGLIAHGRVRGALVPAADPALLDDDVLALLHGFADQCALALDTAARLEETSIVEQRDPLTGLLTHRAFHERLEAALAVAPERAQPLAILIADLDRFKALNDVSGHAEGDRVLRGAASALSGVCRASDPCFRLGGDEFGVLLIGADGEDAREVGRRAQAALEALDARVGLSFGTACWPVDADEKDALLAVADERLQATKRSAAEALGPAAPLSAAQRQHERLAVASRLSTRLAPLQEPRDIATVTVNELHLAFQYYLAVIQRLDHDNVLRVVAASGPLTDAESGFLALEQPVTQGVNGRVARTGESALILDTRHDPDYLRRDARTDPGSELSVPIRVDGEIWGVLNLEQVSTHAFTADDELLAETISAQVGAALHRTRLLADLEATVTTTLATLVDVLEAQDAYTAQHARDVVLLAQRVGARLGLNDDELRHVGYAALLHDIGKIAVPSELLRKPAALTDDEFEQVKRHSEVGGWLLERIPFLSDAAPLVRGTHERWDGRGYPDGLVGEETPLGARIVSVCDALDAMVTDRAYRSAMDHDAALAELQRCAGTQFDPAVVEAVIAEVQSSQPVTS
jgi:diguanylate cyclase (GGDEF)-like protein